MLLIRHDFTASWKLGPFQSSSKSGERSVSITIDVASVPGTVAQVWLPLEEVRRPLG
jgi:hypothetical protein